MSPASLDALELERYIGSCLFSQNRLKELPRNRVVYQGSQVYAQNGYINFQNNCQLADRWADGAPLISFAAQYRGNRKHKQEDTYNNHLARLAVHTQGAPLILTKSYNHRKNKPQRNNKDSSYVAQQTKVFENSNTKKHFKSQELSNNGNNVKAVDSVSVTSDESSSSQSSETSLPRIIKPRKRRKKDRKPFPHINRSLHNQSEFSTDNTNHDDNTTSLTNILPYLPCLESFPAKKSSVKCDESKKCFDLLGDISEAPKLHHSFEEVEEVQDVNGNLPASTCQCRYCDPEGQIWDVDRSCYSPFLTPPKSLDVSNLFPSYPFRYSDNLSLAHRLSTLSLQDDKHKPPFVRSTSSSSSASSFGDLEVSTEIVTSLNGHRDLEIKFWLNSAVDSKSTKNSLGSDM